MDKPPHVENAPGLSWYPRRRGQWEAWWRARTDLVAKGYKPKNARLWLGIEPTEAERSWISDRCRSLQDDMLVWGRGGIPVVSPFDGTIKSLIACYQTDADSPYRKLRFRSRVNYDSVTRRIERDHGDEAVANMKARTFLRWHGEWSADGHITMAHGLIGMLRTLFSFGATFLENDECERVAGVLHRMRFKMSRPRNERLTAEQANAVRAKAHDMRLHSIALAQAFQFEVMLRQTDVIGEWVPQSEPGTSDIISGNEKWLRGLRWSEIDSNLILRHTTSKRGKVIEIDLRAAPMVMEELALLGDYTKLSGPIVVYERTRRPYVTFQFRAEWRKVADAAGIPKTVFNMDSRAGAISEATDAGAELEHVRHAATHSNIATTQNYSRGPAEKIGNVQRLRVEHRNKK